MMQEKRKQVSNLSPRLGRRPWKIDENFDHLKAVLSVRGLNGSNVRSLI